VTTLSRDRVGWWIYVLLLAGTALFIGHSFVGLLVLGLFGYYATRPICDHVSTVVDSESLAAVLTVLTVLVPVFLVVFYAGYRILQQLQRRTNEGVVSMLTSQFMGLEAVPGTDETDPSVLLQHPPSLGRLTSLSSWSGVEQAMSALNGVFGGVLLIALAVGLAYALLEYDEALSDGFATLVGGRETTVYTYALAVDDDLESIFFGNLLFAVVMSVIATVTYAATNLVAPAGIQVPLVFALGFLTGVASLIPVVVGKIVYVPVVAYLGFQATETGSGFVFVGGALAVYVLVLDLLPQSFIQPYVSGRQVNTILLLFAYILGPILFGWYGFFLMPILFVLMLETVRIVLPELLHAEPIGSDVNLARGTGADPEDVSENTLAPDDTDSSTEPTETAQSWRPW
jgi:predicted PurR-regulated permease PerM